MTPRPGRPHFGPGRPHFGDFGPPAERRPFCKKVFGHWEKAWFSRFSRPRGAVGHFSRFDAHLYQVHVSRLDPKVPHFSPKDPPVPPIARRRRKKSRHQRPFSFCLLTFLLSAFAGHVSGPSFPFSCVLAHGEHPVINESCVWAFAGHVMALLSLLFLCACARASPAIVSFFFVAVSFVWYASFDTPIVYTSD